MPTTPFMVHHYSAPKEAHYSFAVYDTNHPTKSVISVIYGLPASLSSKHILTLVDKGFVSAKMFKQLSELYAKEFNSQKSALQKDARLYRILM